MPRGAPFPTEDAPNYDPENPYSDRAALKDHRAYLLGKYFILEARARLLRDKVKECYAKEGVNHFERCKEARDNYLIAAQKVNLSWMDAPAWKERGE